MTRTWNPWRSLAGALASEIVMERALTHGSSDLRWLAYAARGVDRVGYGRLSARETQLAADRCLREVGL